MRNIEIKKSREYGNGDDLISNFYKELSQREETTLETKV